MWISLCFAGDRRGRHYPSLLWKMAHRMTNEKDPTLGMGPENGCVALETAGCSTSRGKPRLTFLPYRREQKESGFHQESPDSRR